MAEVQFIVTDPEYYEKLLVAEYESTTGRTLYPADPERLQINVMAYGLALMAVGINESAKQNLLAYANDNKLDYLGALLGVTRLEASPAEVTLKCYLNQELTADLVIPAGTSVNVGSGSSQLTWETTDEKTIPAGSTEVSITAQCTTAGISGNGFLAGQISGSVGWTSPTTVLYWVNTDTSSGGTDAETDDNLRSRIQLAPEAFSNAGSKGAYEYWTKTAHADISDVKVTSPSPGDVAVYVLLTGGILPSSEILSIVLSTLNDTKVRPLTDHVTVLAPTTVNYAISLTWYLDQDYQTLQASIVDDVDTAVSEYIAWQKAKIGRDTNPSRLVDKIMNIDGVKRVDVTTPVFTSLTDSQIANLTDSSVLYGGVEDE